MLGGGLSVFFKRGGLLLLALFVSVSAMGGEQREEDLSDSVRSLLCGQILTSEKTKLFFASPKEGQRWLTDMSARLRRVLPSNSVLQDAQARRDFLTVLHYNAQRAAVDPQLVLAIVHVESAFRKYAISSAGAQGYMQVMPFWVNSIGSDRSCGTKHNLFQLHTNLRYGTVIFGHYLDKEDGDLYRALGRYNGSLGKKKYPNAIFKKLEKYWRWK